MRRKTGRLTISIFLSLILMVVMATSVFADTPVAYDDSATTDEDTPVDIDVLANDTDVDEDTLFVDSVTQGTHGSVTNNSTNVTYTPDADYEGADWFTYTVSDGNGGTDSANVTITVNSVNDPPVAYDDSATTDEDTPVDIDVLANDTDVDGDTLTVDSVTQGTYGAVTNNGITVTYSPDTDYEGPDWFTYTVSDGNGGTDSANVTISVGAVNDPPVADANGPYISNEGTAVNFDASGSSDIDGDTLQYRWDFENDGTWDTTWTSNSSAQNTWYDDWSGMARVEVFDGLLSDNATATVTINNVPPTVSAGPDQAINSGDNVTINVSFTDPGTLDMHTADIDWGDGNNESGTVSEVNGSGNVTGSHQYSNLGSYTVTITVTDDDGGQGSDSFQVEVRIIDVEIDIKPGSDTNPINLDSKGRIPVAILTNESLDATEVDASTVRFGPGQAVPVHYAIEDIDGDGDDDMILHFNTQELGLTEDDVEATLTGETTEGAYFSGTDSVKITPSKDKEKDQNGKAEGKENAPGQNKEPGQSADGIAKGNADAPGQNKEPGQSASGKAKGNEGAPGQNKEPGQSASGKSKGKGDAPGQNK